MGTITLKVPQDIYVEYQIDSSKMMAQLLEWLKPLKPQTVKNDKKLLGLFAGDADCIEPITESTIPEKHHNQRYQ